MLECGVVREQMPLLLTESLDLASRERAHLHIEDCTACESEWRATKETWDALATLPDLPVPVSVRAAFLAEIAPPVSNVVPFRRRPVAKWIAQAATVAVLTGGAFFAGRTLDPAAPVETPQGGRIAAAAPGSIFNIAESTVLPASQVNPDIQGRPDIRNVRFLDRGANGEEIGISFDVTSKVTVTGNPSDENLVKLVSSFLRDPKYSTVARSNAIQWVRQQYTAGNEPAPELVNALASIVTNDDHEGVRNNALDALKNLAVSDPSPEVTQALVNALKNDPNPAVRIKAVEALANLSRSSATVDPSTVDTLRQKASQNDENTYVRVKAAEALSQLNL
jgi:hypothetical protein